MSELSNQLDNNEIKNLLEKNLALTQEIYAVTKKLKNYLKWQRVGSVIYILIIVVPLILAFFYLPQMVNFAINAVVPGGIEQKDSLQQLLK